MQAESVFIQDNWPEMVPLYRKFWWFEGIKKNLFPLMKSSIDETTGNSKEDTFLLSCTPLYSLVVPFLLLLAFPSVFQNFFIKSENLAYSSKRSALFTFQIQMNSVVSNHVSCLLEDIVLLNIT